MVCVCVCVCALRDYSLTWDEGADGLEIAQSGREKRVVGKAMMEWSRAGWMDGWEARLPDAGA
jgi:hypothetical protein